MMNINKSLLILLYISYFLLLIESNILSKFGLSGNKDFKAKSIDIIEEKSIGATAEILKNPQNVEVYVRKWSKKSSKAKATILLVHGFSWHSKYFFQLAKHLTSKLGVDVVSYDLQGHGKSGTINGMKGYAEHFDDFVKELNFIVQRILSDKNPNHKFFIFAESMGGAIVIRALTKRLPALQSRLAGIILAAPIFRVAREVLPPPPVLVLVKLMSSVYPHAMVPTTEVADTFDTAFGNQVIAKQARNDPLVIFESPRIRTASEVLETVKENEKLFSTITVPILVLHGEQDTRTYAGNSRDLFAKLSSKDKTLKIYPTGRHQLLQDTPSVTNDVLNVISDWLSKRI